MTITFECNVMYVAHFLTADSGTITHLGECLICLLKVVSLWVISHVCLKFNDTCMSGQSLFGSKNVTYCVSDNPLIL